MTGEITRLKNNDQVHGGQVGFNVPGFDDILWLG